jgi:type IV pilus assembly protein PilA
MKTYKKNEGFSLVELLVVVIIIGIIAAIAIPSLLASRRAANEASAIQSLRSIHSAQATYYATTGAGAYGDLAALSGAGLLDPTFTGATMTKSGYTIAESAAAGAYCAEAEPVSATSGTRLFGVDDKGVIYQGVGTGKCATGVLDKTGGAPIQ